MNLRPRFWYLIVWVNFLLVALVGMVMRYKIIAPLPWLEQKNLMQAHGHFAFNAWVTLGLLIFITDIQALKKARSLFGISGFYLLCLIQFISFLIYGYSIPSLISTVLLQIPLWYMVVRINNELKLNQALSITRTSLRFAFPFLLLAQLALIILHIKMIRLDLQQSEYLGIWYFFLHFSYNGWFLFGIAALFFGSLSIRYPDSNLIRKLLIVLGVCVFPAYLLSLLWLNDSMWIAQISRISSAIQLVAFIWLLRILHRNIQSAEINPIALWFWRFATLALTLKFLLQFFQNFELFEQIAFSHRSIVIGYLHLVFLGFVTLFLLGFMQWIGIWNKNLITSRLGLILVTSGIFLNEIILMIQGILSIQLKFIPSTNTMLFAVTLIIITGIVTLSYPLFKFRASKE